MGGGYFKERLSCQAQSSMMGGLEAREWLGKANFQKINLVKSEAEKSQPPDSTSMFFPLSTPAFASTQGQRSQGEVIVC